MTDNMMEQDDGDFSSPDRRATTKGKLFAEDDGGTSESEEASENDEKFQINKKFASAYEKRKAKEELRRVKFDVDDDDDDDDASTSSSEDEDGKLLTTSIDVNILKTINSIRKKDKSVYDPQTRFFDNPAHDDDDDDSDEESDSGDDAEASTRRKNAPKRYKDVVREEILEKMETEEKSDDDENDGPGGISDDLNNADKTLRLAYNAEQKELRKAFLESTKGATTNIDSDDDSSEDLLIVKSGKLNTTQDDDSETRKEFEKQIQELEATTQAGHTIRIKDPRGEVKDADKFLLDFFKNRAWIDKDHHEVNDDDSGSSDEEVGVGVCSDSDNKVSKKKKNDDESSLEDIEKADDFEAKYNFRFEEAASENKSGADFSIISYARGQTMNTLRRKDETRREKRLARKERKALERKAKEEQLRRLKNAKRQEMEEKLKQIKSVLGEREEQEDGAAGKSSVDEATLLQLLEGDFDPEKFETLMKETYNDDFYQQTDAQWKSDKDVRESLKNDEDGVVLLEDDGEDAEESDKDDVHNEQDENAGEEEWPDDMEEEDYVDEEQPEIETELERKVKDRMKEELYKLDYEDIVAGMPTRFKYRQVEPNNYGLTTAEILFARDTTLRQYVSLKKLAPYREDGEFKVNGKKRRSFRELLQRDLEEATKQENDEFERIQEEKKSSEIEKTDDKKKRRRKRRKKSSEDDLAEAEASADKEEAEEEEVQEDVGQTAISPDLPKAKRRRRKKNKTAAGAEVELSDEKAGTGKGETLPKQKESPTAPKHMETSPKQIDSKAATKHVDSKTAPKKMDSAHPVVRNEDVTGEVVGAEKQKKHHKSKKKQKIVCGVSETRLASYGF